jgi:electron transport complex protein RnfD
VAGILLAYNLPAEIPLWMPVLGGIFSIAIAKQAFGGLGFNPVNPALAARAFMLASWPVDMTVFKTLPRGGTLSGTTIELFSGATPLNALKQSIDIVKHANEYSVEKVIAATQTIQGLETSYTNLFFGRIGGCLGETSVFLLLLGAAFLMYRRIIGWRIPFVYIGTVAVLMWIFGGSDGLFSGDPIFHVLAGGLILGAFYMATDMVTSPITSKGQVYFAIGCGIIVVVIRLVGGYPEGVAYSILLMNLAVPLLNRYTKPRILGERKNK